MEGPARNSDLNAIKHAYDELGDALHESQVALVKEWPNIDQNRPKYS